MCPCGSSTRVTYSESSLGVTPTKIRISRPNNNFWNWDLYGGLFRVSVSEVAKTRSSKFTPSFGGLILFGTLINHIDPLWIDWLPVTKWFMTLCIPDLCCLELRYNKPDFETHAKLNLFHIVNVFFFFWNIGRTLVQAGYEPQTSCLL